MQVSDLIREKQHPEDGYAVIVHIGDLRAKEPYKVFCPYWQGVVSFDKKYVQEQCEVVSCK